jgi:autotransporter translocation and assembly factor TamB
MSGEQARLAGQGLLGGGEVQLDGKLLLAPEPRLAMTVSGGRHRLLAPPLTELLVSEQLQVVLTQELVDVTGEIVVHEGTLRHEELPEGSVAVSDRVVLVDYAGNVIREESPVDIQLNVWVRIRDSLEVEGGGLRATVGGDLNVVQRRGSPLRLYGNLNLLSGELSAYRQRLQVSRGTVSFAGNPNNPDLDLRAERDIRSENVTVGVELRGTLEEPVMNVYSEPPMEQSEAMSYLIRGRGLDTGAPLDGTSLALAVGADAVNQSGVLSGFDRLPGISQVRLASEGTADETAATVGGYIGDRLYISYGIGIYEPIAVLTARLYLTARLWLEVVSRLENSVDLYYSFKIR